MIEWDTLVVEMLFLAAIIYFSVYLEHLVAKRVEKYKEKKEKKNIITFIRNDLEQRLRFIEESKKYQDYKPFFTDMWDSVILAGKQSLLPFELFQILQRTYSWMKYYNTELENNNKKSEFDEKILIDLLDDVKKYIYKSYDMLDETKQDKIKRYN